MYLYQLKEEIERVEKLRGDMVRTNIDCIKIGGTQWAIYFVGAEDSRIGKLEDENAVLESDLESAEGEIRDLEYEIKCLKRDLDDKISELDNAKTTIKDLKDKIAKLEKE